jgi:hypothetical protein
MLFARCSNSVRDAHAADAIDSEEPHPVRHGQNDPAMKNYLFAGSDAGGERAACIYTIMQTAKLNAVNPDAYLRNTLSRITEGHPISRIGELMPWSLSNAP